MGARIAALDWSASGLGPPNGWPRCLKSYVHMMLRLPHPAVVLWGPQQVMIYNQAYSDIVGPGKLGTPWQGNHESSLNFHPLLDDQDEVGGVFFLIPTELESVRNAFLANISHEIRTPLSAMLGYTDLLRQADLNEANRKEFLEVIARNGRALARILDDILELSKIQAGRLLLEDNEFSYHQLLEEGLQMFRDPVREKNLELVLRIDADVPERICSDRMRLRQILVNMIGNAVKFTQRGQIVVHASRDRDRFRVTVTDSGIGLNEEQTASLFQPFSLGTNGNARHVSGAGLGLAVSRRFAHALGGDIELIETAPGRGSSFAVHFLPRLQRVEAAL